MWPLALLVLLRVDGLRRLGVFVALWAAFVAATVVIAATADDAVSYLATPARLPEILAGAVLAVVVHHRPVVPGGGWAAGAGLAVILVCAMSWPAAGGPATAGWLPAFALASVALIGGLQRPSLVRTVLSIAPLVWLGRISYGVYLFHWPIYTLVDERRFESDPAVLFVVRLAITLVVATASFYLVELPVRARRVRWRPVAAVAAGASVVVAGIVVVVPDRNGTYTYVAAATRQAAAIVPFAPGEPTELGTRPLRVMVVGDSTAVATGEGLIQWAAEHPDVMRVTSRRRSAAASLRSQLPTTSTASCARDVLAGLVPAVRELQPDVVVAMVTFRDMEDRQWSDAEGLLTPSDRRYRRHLLAGYEWFVTDDAHGWRRHGVVRGPTDT